MNDKNPNINSGLNQGINQNPNINSGFNQGLNQNPSFKNNQDLNSMMMNSHMMQQQQQQQSQQSQFQQRHGGQGLNLNPMHNFNMGMHNPQNPGNPMPHPNQQQTLPFNPNNQNPNLNLNPGNPNLGAHPNQQQLQRPMMNPMGMMNNPLHLQLNQGMGGLPQHGLSGLQGFNNLNLPHMPNSHPMSGVPGNTMGLQMPHMPVTGMNQYHHNQ